MSFFQLVCSNSISLMISTAFIIWISVYLFERMPDCGKRNPVEVILIFLLFIVAEAFVGTIFYELGIFRWKYDIGSILLTYILMTGEIFFLRVLYGESLMVCWLSAIFFEMAESFSVSVGILFMPDMTFHLNVLSERLLYFFSLYGITPLIELILLFVLKKAGVGAVYRQWLDRKSFRPEIVIFLSLYPILTKIVYLLISRSNRIGDQNPMVSIIFLLMVWIIFNYIGREEQQRIQLETQQISMQQQNAYIESLEELQNEMRRFRHDYKNMIEGMYLQVREGDLKAMQSFIQDMTVDFDNQVGNEIQKLTQLGNIHMLEVKGLLLGKIEEMKKEQIDCELEVLRPFYKTRLRSTDLCRCLGILIDNAIDEVRGKKMPKIHIMISSQEECTTVRIKNSLYSVVDFHKIWQQGYSTKGDGRGIGLASYKKILERYENIVPLTTIQDGYFIQELKIQEEK